MRKSILNKIVLWVLALSMTACGKFTAEIEMDFAKIGKDKGPGSSATSNPFVGVQSVGGVKTSGAFRLEAGIGDHVTGQVRTSGAFKFYGGIQGQVVSR